MVNYIRGDLAGDTFAADQDRLTRRRVGQESLNRQMAVDEATRRGLRRILAGGGSATPGAAADPSAAVDLPTNSFAAAGGQQTIAPTPAPAPIEPTPVITPTPAPAPSVAAQPMGYGAADSAQPPLTGGVGQDTLQGGRGVDLLRGPESGGRQAGPDGNVLRSPVGATGAMQIMPSTGPEAAAAAGVAWDEHLFNDPGPAGQAYSEKLGDAWFEKLKQHYNGDERLAAAAYNAGQGRVDQHVSSGRPLPLETQNYLKAVFGGQGGGAPGAAPQGDRSIGRGGLRSMVAGMPSGMTQYGPLLDELSQAPGGGEAALRLLGNAYGRDQRIEGDQMQLEQTFARDDDAMERLAMTALARGDMDVYDHWAQKSGLQIPQAVLADRQQSSLFARGSLVAEQFYKGSPQQAAKFVQGYMQGGATAGFQAAGPPVDNQRVTLKDVQVGDQRLIARVSQNGTNLGYVNGPDGKPVQSATGASGAGMNTNSVKMRDYQALLPVLGEQAAMAAAFGINGTTPGQRWYNKWLEGLASLGQQPDQKQMAEAQDTMRRINASSPSQSAAAAPGVGSPVEAPQGLSAEPSAPQTVYATADDGTSYHSDDNGATWVDDAGSPYVEPGSEPQPQPGLYQ